jgi:hypothetical protein
MKVEVAKPCSVSNERRTLVNPIAERLAASADRLERQAADVRATDKQLALRLVREATKLRQVARGLEIQHKRAARDRMRRRNTPPSGTPREWNGPDQAATLRAESDDATASLGQAREWW